MIAIGHYVFLRIIDLCTKCRQKLASSHGWRTLIGGLRGRSIIRNNRQQYVIMYNIAHILPIGAMFVLQVD